jgi:hypothetical protein
LRTGYAFYSFEIFVKRTRKAAKALQRLAHRLQIWAVAGKTCGLPKAAQSTAAANRGRERTWRVSLVMNPRDQREREREREVF